MITLTVSNAGYKYNPDTGTLDFEDPEIQKCIDSADEPATAIGYIVKALERRMNENAPPLTIMSCDNVPANGVVLRHVVMAYAARKSTELLNYIENNITFPSTMVDRITPRTSERDRNDAKNNGSYDQAPVSTEHHRDFVIENNFAGEVPDFESAGAIVTDRHAVTVFELAKLRMLNGTHVAIGCIGKLAGYNYVDQAMKEPVVAKFINALMTETAATIPSIKELNTTEYIKILEARLQNPHLEDELSRVARNGTQKISDKILDTIIDLKVAGRAYEHNAFAVAAWLEYLKGYGPDGREIDIADEYAVKNLQTIARNSGDNAAAIMTASRLFDQHLMADHGFVESVSRHLHNIHAYGVIDAIGMIESPQHDLHHAPHHDGIV